MKKLAIIAAFLFALIQIGTAQKQEKSKLKYDDATKTLTRTRFIEVEEVIDTARLYQERARLLTEKEKIEAQLDSNNVQIKEARKLITGKKGNGNNGNNRAAETPTVPPATTPTTTTTKTKKTKKQ